MTLELEHFLSVQYVRGDLCKHLRKDSSTDHPDQYQSYLDIMPKYLSTLFPRIKFSRKFPNLHVPRRKKL